MKTKMKQPKSALQNAMKGEEPASVQIQMRATVTRKERYKAQAIQEDLNLTEWMANHLDAVCDAAEGKASVSIFSRLYRRRSQTASTRSSIRNAAGSWTAMRMPRRSGMPAARPF
jgi:hypothetical protein